MSTFQEMLHARCGTSALPNNLEPWVFLDFPHVFFPPRQERARIIPEPWALRLPSSHLHKPFRLAAMIEIVSVACSRSIYVGCAEGYSTTHWHGSDCLSSHRSKQCFTRTRHPRQLKKAFRLLNQRSINPIKTLKLRQPPLHGLSRILSVNNILDLRAAHAQKLQRLSHHGLEAKPHYMQRLHRSQKKLIFSAASSKPCGMCNCKFC